jgi:hypothetical protein
MFATIGHTFELMKMSWNVLMKDRELVLFPIFSGVGVLILALAGLAFGVGESGNLIVFLSMILIAYFITTFFNAALISAALERLRGGDPNVMSGLSHASKHIHHIFLWAVISAIVGTLFRVLRSQTDNIIVRMIYSLIEGVWEFMTFFVIPVMVSENQGPISGIKRSASIIRETWGRQITATFGFFIVYLVAVIGSAIPAILLFLIAPAIGIIVGILLVGFAIAVVQTLEGIFKAALYDYAVGAQPEGFDLRTLQTAYQPDYARA